MEHLTESKEMLEKGGADSERIRIKVGLKLQELKDTVFWALTRRISGNNFSLCHSSQESHPVEIK